MLACARCFDSHKKNPRALDLASHCFQKCAIAPHFIAFSFLSLSLFSRFFFLSHIILHFCFKRPYYLFVIFFYKKNKPPSSPPLPLFIFLYIQSLTLLINTLAIVKKQVPMTTIPNYHNNNKLCNIYYIKYIFKAYKHIEREIN